MWTWVYICTTNKFEKKNYRYYAYTCVIHMSRLNYVYLTQLRVKKATFLASSHPPSSWAGLLAQEADSRREPANQERCSLPVRDGASSARTRLLQLTLPNRPKIGISRRHDNRIESPPWHHRAPAGCRSSSLQSLIPKTFQSPI